MIEQLLYPVFKLPHGIDVPKDNRKLSRDEAKKYFDALTAYFPWRVLLLLSWHDENITPDPEDDLLRLGHKVAAYINQPDFIYHEDLKLDWQGQMLHLGKYTGLVDTATSMAIDMGFFLAIQLLQLEHCEMRWAMRLGGKTMSNYQSGIVFGPGILEFNPITDSRGWGSSIVEGIRLPSIWCEYYQMWSDHVAGREPRYPKRLTPLDHEDM